MSWDGVYRPAKPHTCEPPKQTWSNALLLQRAEPTLWDGCTWRCKVCTRVLAFRGNKWKTATMPDLEWHLEQEKEARHEHS